MTRLVRSGVLATFMAVIIGAGGGFTAAQNKTAPAKTAPASKDEKVGTVEVTKDVKGQFRFKVVGTDTKAIMQSSKGYATKEEALKAIDEVKSILSKGKVVDPKE